MFPLSSAEQRPIASALLSEARRKEERYPGLHVLAAREFRYPIQQQQVNVRVEMFRKLNLLEKFVLRAYTEISPIPSHEELAEALGLDPVFIKSTFDDLVTIRNISTTRNTLSVTEEGKRSLASETVPEDTSDETRYLIQDLLLGTEKFSHHPLDEMSEELEDLSNYIKKDLTQFSAFEYHFAELQPHLRKMELDLHNPDENRFVTEIKLVAPAELRWRRIAIYVLYDSLSDEVDAAISIQAEVANRPIRGVVEWLEAQIQEQNVSLKTLCGLSDEIFTQEEMFPNQDSSEVSIVEERLEEIRQHARSQLRLKRDGRTIEKDAGTATQLRDIEIRPAFLKALREAHEQIIIYSPWINEQVVDDAFLSIMEELVQKGVRILIGYGIGRDEKREDRPIPPELLQRLRSVQTAEGTPGIIAQWLGNSHAKEIIIDRSIHFSGSHNWLSYRGDRLPRGETVYQVTILTEVEKAYYHLSHRFIERAKLLWSKATDEERKLALCILCTLECEQEAIELIQRDTCYHFIPLWLIYVQQAIFAGHAEHILTPLKTGIILCSTAIEPQNPLRVEIVTRLQDVLKAMKLKNRELLTLFTSENFAEFKPLETG